jgi:DNA-binding beta-propeller fold protein YncE
MVVGACGGGTAGDGPRLYVTSGFGDEALILDPVEGVVMDRRSLDPRPGERDEPHGIDVSPDGRHWYATLSHGEPTLWKFETREDRRVGTVTLPLRGAARVEVSPDGSHAAVADYWLGGLGEPSQVALVELATLRVIDTPTVCPAPHHAAWDPAGARLAVTCSLSDEVVILDAATLEPEARFPVLAQPNPSPGNPVAKPMNVAWSPDGSRIYVTLARSGRVAAFEVDGTPVWSTATGDGPAQIEITPGGEWLVVAHRGGGTLGLVDAATGEARVLPLAEAVHPHGVALDTTGTRAFVTFEGTTTSEGGVAAVDLEEGRVLWSVRAGLFTLGVAYLPAVPAPSEAAGASSSGVSGEASRSSSSETELMQ